METKTTAPITFDDDEVDALVHALDRQIEQLGVNLPPRVHGQPWISGESTKPRRRYLEGIRKKLVDAAAQSSDPEEETA